MDWNELIGGSTAWERVQALPGVLDELETHAPANPLIRRCRHLNLHAEHRLRALDPLLVFPAALQRVSDRIDDVRQAMVGHMTPEEGVPPTEPAVVATHLDALAEALSTLPIPLAAIPADVDAQVLSLNSRVDEVLRTAQSTVKDIGEQSASLGQRVEALNEDQVAPLSAELDRLATKLAETESGLTADAQAALEAVRSVAESQGTEIRKMRDEAKRLLGEIGRIGTTEGYSQWEAEEVKAAERWRTYTIWLGIALGAVITGLLTAQYIWDFKGDGGVPAGVGTVAITGALGALTKYAANQSALHRRNVVFARRTALELASFGPYVEDLDEEARDDLRIMLVSRYFGRASQGEQEPDAFEHPLQEIAKRAQERRRATKEAAAG